MLNRDSVKINSELVTDETYIDTGLTNGVEYVYTITAVDTSDNESDESTGVIATPQGSGVTLDVIIAEDSVKIGDEFTADIALEDATNIYAEDFTIEYDSTLFEYLGYELVTGHQVYNQPTDDNGILRFIVASQGMDYGITGEKTFIKLNLRAKAVGVGTVDALQCRIADTESEFDLGELECGEDTITIVNQDVNRSGEYTLLDLAIDGFFFGQLASAANPTVYSADQAGDALVNDDDLAFIVNQMLLNANYTPNL